MSDNSIRQLIARKHLRWLVTVVVLLTVVSQPLLVLGVQPVAAQSGSNSSSGGSGSGSGGGNGGSPTDFANSVCNSTGYKLVLGMAYVVVGLAFVALIVGGLVGAGMLSFSWVGRSLSTIASSMLTGSLAGVVLMLIILTVLSIGLANISFDLPSSCTWILG